MNSHKAQRLFRSRPWLFAVAAAAALTAGAAIAVVQGTPEPPSIGSGQPILEESTGDDATITSISGSAFATTIVMVINLPESLSIDEVFAVAPEKTLLSFDDGTESFTPTSLAYDIGSGRQTVTVTAQFGTPPIGENLTVVIGEVAAIPNDGNGRVVMTDVDASAQVDIGRLNESTTVASGGELDTGFGWSYAVDSIETDGTVAKISYSVRGNTNGLVGLPVDEIPGVVMLSFPEDGKSAIREIDLEESQASITLGFGRAARPVSDAASVVLTRSSNGTWMSEGVAEAIPSASNVEVEESGGFISIRLTAPVLFTGAGSPGNFAKLQDDVGNTYELFHMSGTLPPSASQWDFTGPLSSTATRLELTVPGYSVTEEGNWTLPISLR